MYNYMHFVFVVLVGIETRALSMVDEHSPTEQYLYPTMHLYFKNKKSGVTSYWYPFSVALSISDS